MGFSDTTLRQKYLLFPLGSDAHDPDIMLTNTHIVWEPGEMKAAHRGSWQIKPMPQETTVLDYRADFSFEEFDRISRGLIPQDMDDKWFVYLDGNTLHVHRGSGICIYQVEFATGPGKHRVCCALVNRDQNQYLETDDAYDSKFLHCLISHFLLGKQVEWPPFLPEDRAAEAKHWWRFW